MTPPRRLLWLEQARIDRGGVPLCNGLDAEARADRVALVGDWSALFNLLAGRARLVRGRAEVGGVAAEDAVPNGLVGLAARDGPAPRGMRVLDFLSASGRLLGLEPRTAKRQAEQALGELGLGAVARQRGEQLAPWQRRGVELARTLMGDPGLIALEEPLRGLDERSADMAAGWIARVAAGRKLLVSVGEACVAGPERGLLDTVEELLVLSAGRVKAQGAPDRSLRPAPRYSLVVRAPPGDLIASLQARGLEVDGAPPEAASPEQSSQGAVRLIVQPTEPVEADFITDLLVELKVPVIELVPIAWSDDQGV